MGYFEGLTDANFVKIEDSGTIFYPNGMSSKGYILPDKKNKEVKSFIIKYYKVSLPLIILVTIIGGLLFDNPFLSMILLPILIIYYNLKLKSILPEKVINSTEKLRIKEQMKIMAQSMGMKRCVFYFFSSLFMTVCCLYVLLFIGHIWISIMGLIFSGICLIQAIFMIFYSKK